MISRQTLDVECDHNQISRFDLMYWRLLIWAMGLATPIITATKPRRFTVSELELVEATGGPTQLVTKLFYVFFLMLALITCLRYLVKLKLVGDDFHVRSLWILVVLVGAMPTISTIMQGGSLRLGFLGLITIYTVTYFLPLPSIEWYVFEIRLMLLIIFIYGSLAVALFFPQWAWNLDYLAESSTAIFPLRLFGVANHANALAPIAVVVWLLGYFKNCRVSGEIVHKIAIIAVVILAQSKTNWVIIAVMFVSYVITYVYKYRSTIRNPYYLFLLISVLAGLLVAAKYSFFSNYLVDIVEDPQLITLTGRLPLWLYAIDLWLEKPLFGQGLDAWSSDTLLDIVRILGWAAPNAHNQIFQVLSEAGIMGLLVLASLFICYVKLVNKLPDETRIPIKWLSVPIVLASLTEVTLQYSIGTGYTLSTWIVFTSVMIAVRQNISLQTIKC